MARRGMVILASGEKLPTLTTETVQHGRLRLLDPRAQAAGGGVRVSASCSHSRGSASQPGTWRTDGRSRQKAYRQKCDP
jgi:hypothetical protein